MQRAVKNKTKDKAHSQGRKIDMKNPLDKDLHKMSTKVVEKIFEDEPNDSLIE
jgi:hypothetical protein